MRKNERFTMVYKRYEDLVFWYAKKRLSNEELSKECVQQVFMKYYEHMDTVSEEMIKTVAAYLLQKRDHRLFQKDRETKGI